MKRRHLFTGFIAALGLLIAMVIAPAAAANASTAPSCYGQSCDSRDPSATNCTQGAYTIYSRDAIVGGVDYGVLELRYSPRCYSNWVRFTPWGGLRSWLGNLAANAEISGSPWIWRLGVANSLRGQINQSSPINFSVTSWTSMVTAAGTTCWSVGIYQTEFSQSGGGARDTIGTYDAPCVS